MAFSKPHLHSLFLTRLPCPYNHSFLHARRTATSSVYLCRSKVKPNTYNYYINSTLDSRMLFWKLILNHSPTSYPEYDDLRRSKRAVKHFPRSNLILLRSRQVFKSESNCSYLGYENPTRLLSPMHRPHLHHTSARAQCTIFLRR